jgi:hypothetical protein
MLQAYAQTIPEPLRKWALEHCMDVIRQSGPDEVIHRGVRREPYMERWHLLRKNPQSGIENIYLHRFIRDDTEDLHDHPWANASCVLHGKYVEQSWSLDGRRTDTRSAGDIVMRSAEERHAITGIEVGTITLFVTGPKVREWGFWLASGFMHWREYHSHIDRGRVPA